MESAVYVGYGLASIAALALIPLALAELFPEEEPEVEAAPTTVEPIIEEAEPVTEEEVSEGDGTIETAEA